MHCSAFYIYFDRFLKPLRAPILAFLALASAPVSADAIIRNLSMFASTIAEIFIEDNQIRIELEIGAQDVKAFSNLLWTLLNTKEFLYYR